MSFHAAALSKITASVSENPVSLNESIDLVLTVDDKVDSNIFDFSVLEQNFRVLGTSVSSETRMINFDTSRITRFTTRLMPRTAGKLTIPEFTHQGVSSAPITLTVTAQADSQQAEKDIYVETELSANSVWLQQQVTYTTRLYLSTQISSGSLTQPEIEGAVVEQQGKDKEYDKIINGVAYRVIERSYKIVPQRSGEFTIESPLFQAEVIDTNRRQFGFGRTKTISRVGPSQILTVKAIPDNYSGHWLPSELVMLNDELEPKQAEYFVGEPITRVITLSALDVSAEQLPQIKVEYPASIKVYPDQADVRSNLRDDHYVSQRVETSAIIPNQTGTLTLPAVSVTWWDTKREKMQTTSIEAKTIKVVANPNIKSQQAPSNVPATPITSVPSQNNQPTQTDCNCQNEPTRLIKPSPWHFNYLAILLFSLWIVTLIGLLWYINAKAATKPNQQPTDNSQSEKIAWSRLLKACEKNNIELIQQLLPNWTSQITGQSVATVYQAINQLNNVAINEQISQMQASRFAKNSSQWQANKLISLLKTERQNRLQQKAQAQDLSPLNPK
ncbi:BatD family protein [Catenovulum sp. 2E275]|uniref:BatD family protein n=1 Tax=Catenovulum sp. 2E275 TaxID=2980497 RepID=UPI0021CF0850|nr:BatD family protein [Catenovulum sp. 2E275]MCU4676876.1 BatD family protein [Catenovulum sp. 2E275]